MFKKLYLMLVLAAALACNASPSKPVYKNAGPNDLQPDEQQSVVLGYVAKLITDYNYKKVPLNDSISAIIYDRYLKRLDENHNYLLASDIKQFDQFKSTLDDDIKAGNLANVFYMFNIFQKRYTEYVNFSVAELNKNFDFTKNETYTYDRDSLPWVATEADLHNLWAQRVKYDLLNLKLTGKELAANKATLKKRYTSILSQSNKLSNQDVFQAFMDAFTEAIDPHTNYFNPAMAANFNIDMSRSLEGIGASLQIDNEYVTIKGVTAGGPADKSKQVNVEDRIIGVAQGKTGEFQDIVGWRIDNAIALIRGAKGTTVRLQLLPKGSAATAKPRIVELVREKIILKDISAKKEIRTYNSNGKTVKIGVISIPAFYLDFADYKAGNPNYKSTTRDVKLILDSLKRENVDGVVVDLRQNGGGSLIEAIELTGLFIKSGPVVQVRDARNQIEVDKDEDPAITYAGPLAIMVDRFSASASEIFSGAIQDYGRGLIIGTQTYGKGSVQNAIDLDKVITPTLKDKIMAVAGKSKTVATGSQNKFGQLNLTVAKFYRVSGSSTQHKGVMPDISFPSIIPMDKYGEDTEPSAMPFDMIPKSDYAVVGNFATVIPQLKKLHDDRMAASASFKYLLQDIEESKKQANEKSVTLNEQKLKQERDADEQKSFENNNLRRVALGLPAMKKGQVKPKNEDLDFLQKEAGQILTDYLTLDNKLTNVKPTGTF
ncbi:carboxy terminal-processing peptidase [Mucilaginibacter phyllosphaerae]|uniref:Carboxyl-terminal processing protease n=1 Tax=Mucilaginibacter phyllosphaerae TaxID=1812349 RepID=A0A4Y8A849_9SPHI|nr:carboxy terminal-processing peptidase [Mucilaginibacter phyllosphaerae]MBB3971172.1 carboxyl-terminal processing protease [Mucilaginibacter phyllosphaerae]TEW63897.1 tail-specific protease [Mucilaginibacter phyllosphaerae]